MRTRFTAAPGVSLRAIGLQTGYTRGIEIDNPSGSWLYIPSLETWVEPYTLGWSSSFPYDVSSIDIVAGNGPSGQIATTQGDAIVVYLVDTVVPQSMGSPAPGKPFIERFTPVIPLLVGFNVPFTTGIVTLLVAATVGRRIRLLSWYARRVQALAGAPGLMDTGVSITIGDTLSLAARPIAGYLTNLQPFAGMTFPEGVDFTISAGLEASAVADWADGAVEIGITYQVI